MIALMKDDSFRVTVEMNQTEYEQLKLLADSQRTAEDDSIREIAEEIHYLPTYWQILQYTANMMCKEMGYENMEALERAIKECPLQETPEEIEAAYQKLVARLKAEHLWVEDKE